MEFLDGFPDWFRLLVGLFFQYFVWKVTSTYSTERIIDPRFNGDTIEIDRVYIYVNNLDFFGQSNFLAPRNLLL